MKEFVDAGLPPLKQPFSWAVKAGGVLFMTHGPVRQDGSIDTVPWRSRRAVLSPTWLARWPRPAQHWPMSPRC